MTVTIIAAVASNGAIGRDNALMWHLRADLQYFKKMTYGHPVIMGRRTFASIGRVLKGRLNIVVSRTNPRLPEGAVCCTSLRQALECARATGCGECFVTGGAQVYAEALPFADKLLITNVLCAPSDADAFFPEIDGKVFRKLSQSEILTDEQSGLRFRFEEYGRRV